MAAASQPWWRDAVIYQIYPRSFQDSDGDGEGDLRGIASRLEHVARLGADAIWLSPIYPSPMHDGGYDVADYTGIDPRFGTLEDFDALVTEARRLGLRVLLDVVPCHTSIEHPWFRERPDFYVWSDRDGPRTNWKSSFGGDAWSPDPHGRGWYLHSFYPEQPDLDWRNPEVARAIGDVLALWLARGADGFRLDALDRLLKDPRFRDDPPAHGPPPLPLHPEHATRELLHSRNAPDIGTAIAQLREAAGPEAFLVGEVYLLALELGPYLEHLDACFSFELLHVPWRPDSVRRALSASLATGEGRCAWVLSNHDFSRLVNRVGPDHARGAAVLLLSLPGPVFVYQGDELGAPDGPGADPPIDRFERDRFRHPIAWDAGRHGGFTTGEPWLPVPEPEARNVAGQERDPGSVLHLYRDLVALRRQLAGRVEWMEAADGVLALRRGEHVVAVNMAGAERSAPPVARVLRHSHDRDLSDPPRTLAAGAAFVALAEARGRGGAGGADG